MTALEFIKKFGWDKSAMVVFESIGNGANTFYDTRDELYYGLINDSRVSVVDLKQYVDAWELVEAHGGLQRSKLSCGYPSNDKFGTVGRLNKAIALVEQVNE